MINYHRLVQVLVVASGAVCLMNSPMVRAAEDIKLDEVDLEDLMNIQVKSASKQSQKSFEAPAMVSVVPRDQFYNYGFFTLNDAISHQAGFFLSQDYDRQVLGSRGLFEGWNNNHLLQLMDGVPFNDPMYGSAYTWENTPTFMIKSVEVIRGPGSALYGTNATNGVIAVQTLSGSDLKGKTEGRVRIGSDDARWLEAYTGNVSGNFNYFTGFSSYSTRGNEYQSYDGSGRTAGGYPAKFGVRDNRSSQYMMFKVVGENELKGFSFQYHDQQWRYQTGHGWLFDIPDEQDSMNEHRQVATASYTPSLGEHTHSEFTMKYEHKEIDWFTRYLPNGAVYLGQTYPQGISEYVDTTHDNYFERAQFSFDLPEKMNVLAGVESSTFIYDGDKSHFSNTDLAGNSYSQVAGWQDAPGILGFIKNKPITNFGGYAQFMSGELFTRRIQMTAGVRYDIEDVKYDAAPAGGGKGSRTFKQWSPRLAWVFEANDHLSFKALVGRAFRAPSPSELAGTNTWALANNILNLQPETVFTTEGGVDWHNNDLSLKADVYYTESSNQIGYSGVSNLSTNIYSSTNIGFETELSHSIGKFKNFANLSLAKRNGENIKDPSVTGDNHNVTWAPATTANLGTTYSFTPALRASGLAAYSGTVSRRSSDVQTPINTEERPKNVPAYFGLDAAVQYQVYKGAELAAYVKNVFDRKQYLIKTRDYPFDYQLEGRTYYASFSQSF